MDHSALDRLRTREKLAGLLLGTAVGDAIGLPFEGLSPNRVARRLGQRPLEHRLLFGRGMASDDTEHACLVAQSLLESPDDPQAFGRALARRLRWWLAGAPAGIGGATLRATARLWLGWSPDRSGVKSAGNGPAMRAPLLGACLADRAQLAAFVQASTRLTHSDPRAEQGALAVALAAGHAMRAIGAENLDPAAVFEDLLACVDHPELTAALATAAGALERGDSAAELATALGCRRGISGYVVQTVPAALFLWLAHPGDLRAGVDAAVRLGGDTDTVAAIVGALTGATVGAAGVPADWLAGIWEWPRTIAWMAALAERLADHQEAAAALRPGPAPLFWPGLVPRNALFAGVVLAHGFRRLLPP